MNEVCFIYRKSAFDNPPPWQRSLTQYGARMTLRQCVFANNKGIQVPDYPVFMAGAYASDVTTNKPSQLVMESCTFVGNERVWTGPPGTEPTDLQQGVTLRCDGAGVTCRFDNSIAWDGGALNSSMASLLYADNASYGQSTVTADYSNIRGGGGWAGSRGNIQADPQLGADYVPAAGSPVIDAGNPAYAVLDTTDWLGNTRVRHGRVDMGAVEVQLGSSGTGSGGSNGGAGANRAPTLAVGFSPAQSLGANQVCACVQATHTRL
jgi:hypothetical protein